MTESEKTGNKAARLINDFQDISVAKVVLIILGAWFAIYLVRKILPYLAERGPSQARLYLLGAEPILRLFFLGVAMVWLVPIIFNITLQNFLLIAGAVSVAVGFAFKDYVSSLIAGIVAVVERPYRPGDWVEIGGDYGEVRSVGLRAIQLQTAADNTISVPHSKMWTENVSNSNDGSRTLMCIAEFHLEPSHDAAAMRARLKDVALTSAFLSYVKPVAVMLEEMPWGTRYQVKAYPFDLRDQFEFISDLTVRGKAAIAAAGAREVTAPVTPARLGK